MQVINLNLIPGTVRPVCHASQGDVGRQIRFNLFDGSEVFTLQASDTIEARLRKPDGTVSTAPLSGGAGQTFVDITTTPEMTDQAGACLGEIRITRGANVLGSLNFVMDIEEDPGAASGPAPGPTPGAGLKSTQLNILSAEYTSAPLEE